MPNSTNPLQNNANSNDSSSGVHLVATDGRVLPLKETRLSCDAKGGLARTKLEQTFANPYPEPLAVTYLLPLPADGAVSGFAFRIGERRIHGEVDRKKEARERYERAISEGRSAALLEQNRSSLFTQNIGNIPPRTEVVAEIHVDQRLLWLSEGSWEMRFPTTVAPRYQGEPGRVPDADKLNVPVSDKPLAARMHANVTIRDKLAENGKPESPSHDMRFSSNENPVDGCLAAEGGVPLDRDLVVRWPVSETEVGVSLSTSRAEAGKPSAESAFGMLTIVPPLSTREGKSVSRDLIVLLDTSGSMGGEPLDQAKHIVGALIDSLGDADRLELIEFSWKPVRFQELPAHATRAQKEKALDWLRSRKAHGSTEMADALIEALNPIRSDSQRQVILVTDGFIGFESKIIATIVAKLPKGSVLHTVGVGSSVNRSLTMPAARAGRGIEVVVGLGESPERAVRRLLARTEQPIVTEVVLSGSALVEHAPLALPDLYAGAPVLIGVQLRPEGGTLAVEGHIAEGRYLKHLEVCPIEQGFGDGSVAALFAREKVEDLETSLAAGTPNIQVDQEIESLGLQFQISTRLTSWVAISEEKDVDPRMATRREVMPHELPHGVDAGGLGLSGTSAPMALSSVGAMAAAPLPAAIVPECWGGPGDVGPSEPASMQAVSAAYMPIPTAPLSVMGFAPPPTMRDQKRFSPPRPSDSMGGGVLPSPQASAPTSPGSAPKQSGSLVGDIWGRARAAVANVFAKDSPEEAEPRCTMGMRGRVMFKSGREIVFEVDVDVRGLAWDPDGSATVDFDDNITLEGEVVVERSTAPGKYADRQVVRVVVMLKVEVPDKRARCLTLTSRGQGMIVEIF